MFTTSFKRYVNDLNLAVHACSAIGVNLELFFLLIEVNVEAPVAVLVRIDLLALAFLEVD
jgi:hypothetical protein